MGLNDSAVVSKIDSSPSNLSSNLLPSRLAIKNYVKLLSTGLGLDLIISRVRRCYNAVTWSQKEPAASGAGPMTSLTAMRQRTDHCATTRAHYEQRIFKKFNPECRRDDATHWNENTQNLLNKPLVARIQFSTLSSTLHQRRNLNSRNIRNFLST